jgi:histidine triad (HIT) family protein
VYEDEQVIAIRDIAPAAPVHVLILPKRHIGDMSQSGADLAVVMGAMCAAVPEIARSEGVDKSGYRLMVNQGSDGRQEIEHLHMHLLGGRRLGGIA